MPGHGAVCRQNIFGSGYGLVDTSDWSNLTPNPDFYLGLLWKRVMGTRVLQAASSSRQVRAYAHCHPARNGTVTVAYLNLNDATTTVEIDLKGSSMPTGRLGTPSDILYALSADSLTADVVRLNGRRLAFDSANRAPSLDGVAVTAVSLPPQSFGFVQLGQAVETCKS